ncbi:MAG: ComEA family DNA-binding protein [bacterium]
MNKQEKNVLIFIISILLFGLAVHLFRSSKDMPLPPDIPAPITPLIDINTATAQEFTSLPGIGPVIAERIIAYRIKHGAFTQLHDINKIKGIGSKKFDRFKPYICINVQHQ